MFVMISKNVLSIAELVAVLVALVLLALYIFGVSQPDRSLDLALMMWMVAIYLRFHIIGYGTLVVRKVVRKKKHAPRP